MRIKIVIALPEYLLKPKKLRIEDYPNTGRVYFMLGERILAVAVKLHDVAERRAA